MLKKTFHIIIIAVLALNLMGAWAFASVLDCGMECCKSGAWTGDTSYEAPSCCQFSDVTCGFETGQYEELFDTAICCYNSISSADDSSRNVQVATAIYAPTHAHTHARTFLEEHPPQTTPVYLSNATLIC